MQKQPSKGFVKKGATRNFAKLTRKHPCRNLIFDKIDQNFVDLQLIKKRRCFLVNFGKFVRTLTLQRIASRLLLITAVSIGKGELVNKTINYDTKTKAQGPTEPDQFSSPAERTEEQASEIVVRSCSSNQVFLKILQIPQENICVRVSF